MTSQFEQEVDAALAVFLAAVAEAAERAAVQTIRSAFSQASVLARQSVGAADDHRSHASKSVRWRGSEPEARVVPRRPRVRLDDAAVRAQLAAYLRENPGQSPTRLAVALRIGYNALQRNLHALVNDGALRIEERIVGFNRQVNRACFVVENLNPTGAERSARPTEAMA